MNEFAWSQPAFARIAELVRGRTGLAFGPSRSGDVERGARRAMANARFEDAADYLLALDGGRVALDDLVTELTVHETYFFRESDHFDFVRAHVLPSLARTSAAGRTHQVWSAGCASGEEAYSLAILLEQEGLAERSRVLGTDICRTALAKAHRARYRAWSVRGADQAFISRYFHPDGAELQLTDRIRRRVAFEHLNLAADTYPSSIDGLGGNDLVFCRNVLIYFDRAAVKAVARRLFESLAPGGWLITGPSDPSLSDEAPFETVVTAAGVFYRRGLPAASSFTFATSPAESETRAAPPLDSALASQAQLAEWHDDDAAADGPRAAPIDAQGEGALSAQGVRAVANSHGNVDAERLCAAHLERHPLSAELHYLRALLLVELGRHEEAARAARRVIYLDRSASAAHFVLGSILQSRGDLTGAARAYRNARDLSAARPPGALAFAEGHERGTAPR